MTNSDAPSLTPLAPALSLMIESISKPESIVTASEPMETVQRLDPAQEPWPLGVSLSSPEAVIAESEESPVTESWSRRDIDGEVSIEAVVLARFEEGSKLAVVHLPFMPPLPQVPQIECEPLDSGCEVTITTEAAYRHGAKLTVIRRSAGPAESVPIGIVIYTSVEEEVES